MTTSSLLVDPRVVTGLRRGDAHALERLFRRYYSRLLDLAAAELGDNPRRASGVVEYAFLRVWEEHAWFQTPDVLEVFLDSAVREAAVRERSEPALRRTEPPAAGFMDDAWRRVRELIASPRP